MPPRLSLVGRRALALCLVCAGSLLAPPVPGPLHAAETPAAPAPPAAKPLTLQELTLMLHGGYTGDEILRQTAGRPLLEPLDDAAEKRLRDAGADPRFLDALKSSRRALNDTEADDARQRQAEIDARNAEGKAAYVSRLVDANKQALADHQAQRKQEAMGYIAGRLRGKLVALRDGQLQPCPEDAVANKKLFALYFAAAKSAPCRRFTPALVKFYQDFAPRHAAFETVLISLDKDAAEMEVNLRKNDMPWPALAFDRRAGEPDLMKLAQQGVPRLMVIDGAGRVVSDSYVNGQYVGPQHVLEELNKLAAAGGR